MQNRIASCTAMGIPWVFVDSMQIAKIENLIWTCGLEFGLQFESQVGLQCALMIIWIAIWITIWIVIWIARTSALGPGLPGSVWIQLGWQIVNQVWIANLVREF
jgi:hypothetical protein